MRDNLAAHIAWLREKCPYELGDEHYWGWAGLDHGTRLDLWYLHRCELAHGQPDPTRPLVLGMIDVSSCERHELVSKVPLHIEGSVICHGCGDHGFIRGGEWQPC